MTRNARAASDEAFRRRRRPTRLLRVRTRWIVALLAVAAPGRASATPCANQYQCPDPAEPYCDYATGQCSPGVSLCTGDDAADEPPSDDGRANATPLVLSARVSGAICTLPPSGPQHEWDYYRFDLPAPTKIVGRIAGTGVLASVYEVGAPPGPGLSFPSYPQVWPAGGYYVAVFGSGLASTVARPYEFELRAVECSTESCSDPQRPACGEDLRCRPGPSACTGDDARDEGAGDDGPIAATHLSPTAGSPASIAGMICGLPGTDPEVARRGARAEDVAGWQLGEADWFSVDVAQGEGLEVSVAFGGAANVDVFVGDARNQILGFSLHQNPELVRVTYLPQGRYFIRVSRSDASTAVVPYTLSVIRTPAASCTSSSDCAAEHTTQYYRGACVAGACTFIEAPDAGPCDAWSGVTGVGCSYRPFQSGAEGSRMMSRLCGAITTCQPDEWCDGFVPPAEDCSPFPMCPPPVPGACERQCSEDPECGALVGLPPPPGQAWVYAACVDGHCTNQPAVPAPQPAEPAGASGCGSSPSPVLWPALITFAILARRRRRLPGVR